MATAYSPQDVALSYNGIPISGFADGTFVTITQTSPSSSGMRGADGLYSPTIDKALPQIQATFTLMQDSISNDIMSQALLLQNTSGLTGAFSLILPATGESTNMFKCTIEKAPDIAYGATTEAREWSVIGQGLMRAGGRPL